MDFFGEDFVGLFVHAVGYFGVEDRKVEHYNVLRGLNLISRKGLRDPNCRVVRCPVNNLEQCLSRHAIVFAREVHAICVWSASMSAWRETLSQSFFTYVREKPRLKVSSRCSCMTLTVIIGSFACASRIARCIFSSSILIERVL